MTVAVVLSGGLGAGKSTAAQHLAQAHAFEHLSFVELIWKPILAERGIEPSRQSLQTLGVELIETVGPTGLVDRLLASRTTERIVVDDARRRDVIDYLRSQVETVVHIHLEAGFETRYDRLVVRDGVSSRDEQAEVETAPTETTIAELPEIADAIISNTGDLAEFLSQLDEALAGFGL